MPSERSGGTQMSKHQVSILRLAQVKQRTGRSTSSIYDDIAKGKFPKPVPLGPKAVGWVEAEVDAWIEALIAERDNGTLVRSLPLAGSGQRRRKTEASPQDVRGHLGEPRRVRRGGKGQRETARRADPVVA